MAKRTFQSSLEIRAIVESYTNLPTEEALDCVLDIHASFLSIKLRTSTVRCWNLYFQNSPDYDDEGYKNLQRKMRACTFKTLTFGKGHVLTGKHKQPHCTGCKSSDHDSFNCPFSRLLGWLGFQPNGPGDTAGTMDFVNEKQNGSHQNYRGY